MRTSSYKSIHYPCGCDVIIRNLLYLVHTGSMMGRNQEERPSGDGGATMNRFEYREAQTVQEAVEMMRQEEGARIVAGATDVLIRWRQGAWKPPVCAQYQAHRGIGRGQL